MPGIADLNKTHFKFHNAKLSSEPRLASADKKKSMEM